MLTIAYTADDPRRVGQFWGILLGREVVEDARGALVAGDERQPGLRFLAGGAAPGTPDLLHLHLTSETAADQDATVARALDLGARHLDVGQRPEEGHVVLADPEGNAFCVIDPGNAFLAGCGFLAEVACDGSRSVGVFWSEALGWPLVWDEGDETAVQSPQGGTKIAWGGPGDSVGDSPTRQRFELDLSRGDLGAEVARLVALGATLIEVTGEDALLADPDGYRFRLTVG